MCLKREDKDWKDVTSVLWNVRVEDGMGRGGRFLSPITTKAPRERSSFAVARPMPDEPPVMRTIWPLMGARSESSMVNSAMISVPCWVTGIHPSIADQMEEVQALENKGQQRLCGGECLTFNSCFKLPAAPLCPSPTEHSGEDSGEDSTKDSDKKDTEKDSNKDQGFQ